jgi:NADH-quinone oxidoreductase subunit F
MLFTLDERVVRPGVYEVAFGATWRELLYDLGGGPKSGRPIRAVLPALSCGFIPGNALDTPLERLAMQALGSSLGCGGVSFLEVGEDPLARLAEIAGFFMAEQCGLCPPCRMETNHIVRILEGVRGGKGGDYAGQLQKITSFNRGKGRCSLIEMAAAPVLSGLRLFGEEFGGGLPRAPSRSRSPARSIR